MQKKRSPSPVYQVLVRQLSTDMFKGLFHAEGQNIRQSSMLKSNTICYAKFDNALKEQCTPHLLLRCVYQLNTHCRILFTHWLTCIKREYCSFLRYYCHFWDMHQNCHKSQTDFDGPERLNIDSLHYKNIAVHIFLRGFRKGSKNMRGKGK